MSINYEYKFLVVPIEKDYRSHWSLSGTHEGHDVWINGDDIIHGTTVGVDLQLCNGCLKCIDACPTNVFEKYNHEGVWIVDPINEKECILCLACELVCPTEALHVIRSGGSEDTLESLLG